MQAVVTLYHVQDKGLTSLTPLCPGLTDFTTMSRDPGKAKQQTIERLRENFGKSAPEVFLRAMAVPGRKLMRERLEFAVEEAGERKHITGHFPIVIESRAAADGNKLEIGYHPLRASEWFEVTSQATLSELAERCFGRIFLPSDDFETLKSDGHERLVTIRFDTKAPSLPKYLPPRAGEREAHVAAGVSAELKDLLRVAVNETRAVAEAERPLGLRRQGLFERLEQLMCGKEKSSVMLVGDAGAGKSTAIRQLVARLLELEDYTSHGNLDRVHNVLSLRGRHIIAGMSLVGQWEARCVRLLRYAKQRKVLLWCDDVHHWHTLGRAVGCESSLADFLRGPIARGELLVIGESTPAEWSKLEHEAPELAAAFVRVSVPEADANQTLGMVLYAARQLETELPIEIDPHCYRTIVDLSAALLSGTAFPGKALVNLKTLARTEGVAGRSEEPKTIAQADVIRHFSRQTGLPELLLTA